MVLRIWLGLLLLLTGAAHADATLQSALQLTPDQARLVNAIEADYRKTMASVRGEYNREMRVLRRARIANDSAVVSKQEIVTGQLQAQMRSLRQNTDAAIRNSINTEQQALFDRHIAIRENMVGSSRDERVFTSEQRRYRTGKSVQSLPNAKTVDNARECRALSTNIICLLFSRAFPPSFPWRS